MLFGLIALSAAYAVLHVQDASGMVTGARYVEFRASPDHADVDGTGVPLVRGYVLEIYPAGDSIAMQTIDLGKPSPSADGVIRVPLSSLAMTARAGQPYEAAVTAVGPHGSGTSDRSNRFSFSAAR